MNYQEDALVVDYNSLLKLLLLGTIYQLASVFAGQYVADLRASRLTTKPEPEKYMQMIPLAIVSIALVGLVWVLLENFSSTGAIISIIMGVLFLLGLFYVNTFWLVESELSMRNRKVPENEIEAELERNKVRKILKAVLRSTAWIWLILALLFEGKINSTKDSILLGMIIVAMIITVVEDIKDIDNTQEDDLQFQSPFSISSISISTVSYFITWFLFIILASNIKQFQYSMAEESGLTEIVEQIIEEEREQVEGQVNEQLDEQVNEQVMGLDQNKNQSTNNDNYSTGNELIISQLRESRERRRKAIADEIEQQYKSNIETNFYLVF